MNEAISHTPSTPDERSAQINPSQTPRMALVTPEESTAQQAAANAERTPQSIQSFWDLGVPLGYFPRDLVSYSGDTSPQPQFPLLPALHLTPLQAPQSADASDSATSTTAVNEGTPQTPITGGDQIFLPSAALDRRARLRHHMLNRVRTALRPSPEEEDKKRKKTAKRTNSCRDEKAKSTKRHQQDRDDEGSAPGIKIPTTQHNPQSIIASLIC